MALEVSKTTAYQNGIASAVKSNNAGRKVDMSVDSTDSTVSSNIQTGENTHGQKEIDENYITEEIAKANEFLKKHNTKCTFDYHEETNRIIIRVIDRDTNEVIREIPPEKTLDAVQKMWELAGLLIDERR